MATWHYATLPCPFGSASSTAKICRNGATCCVTNDDEVAAVTQLQARMANHINACHEQDWSDADQISRGIEPQFWSEREPAAPEHQARSRSPRSKSVFGINLDKMSRAALMDLRRAVDGELAKRR